MPVAAAESDGELRLVINESNPADHRLGPDGVPVTAVTRDSIMESHDWPSMSLVKIDVQGAEQRVLKGASEVLRRNRPALFVEVDGGTAGVGEGVSEALLERLKELGYVAHQLVKNTRPLSTSEAMEIARSRGNEDFLFLPLASPQ
jgi:hypothetical protein